MKITLFLGTATTIVLMSTFVSANSIDRPRDLDVETQPSSPLLNTLGVPVKLPNVKEEPKIFTEHFPLLLSGFPKRRPTRLSVGGVWDTTEGKLTLVQGDLKILSSGEYLERSAKGHQILGIYDKRGGNLRGQFINNTEVEGFWYQDYSDVQCSTDLYRPSLTTVFDKSVPTTKYWGRFKFSFNRDGSFTGVYNYCNEETQRSWTGTKNVEPGIR